MDIDLKVILQNLSCPHDSFSSTIVSVDVSEREPPTPMNWIVLSPMAAPLLTLNGQITITKYKDSQIRNFLNGAQDK